MATTTAPPPRMHDNHNHAHHQDSYGLSLSPSSSTNPHRNGSSNNKLNGNMSAGQPHRDFQRPAAPSRASSSGRPSSTPMTSSASSSATTRPISPPPPPPPAPPAPPPPPRRTPTHPKHRSSSSSKLLSQSSLSPSHASLNSNSMVSSSSMQHLSPQQPADPDTRPVKTVKRLEYIRDEERKSKILNHYLVQRKVGKGQHGQVFFGIDMANGMRAVAIKSCLRKNAKEARMEALRKNNPTLHASNGGHGGGMVRTGVFGKLKGGKIVPGSAPGERLYDQLEGEEKKVLREIAIMKKCKHGQVVQLYEVIDDRLSHKIFMVMEFMAGGEIKWQEPSRKAPVLTVDQTRRICRDVVLGLEYLHHQGIIHRDIKPANLLWTADRKNVKITDFGVSHFSYAQRLSALRAGRAWRANSLNNPNSQPPSTSAPSQQGGEIQDEDEASALKSLVNEEGESFDPILFDTLNDSAYALSRQAGTPSFLAPETVWEYREGILDSLSTSAGSSAWVGSLSGSASAGWIGQGNASGSGAQLSSLGQNVAPAERQLRTLPTESALGTGDTIGQQERVQQQPRSASAGDFSSGPALDLREAAAAASGTSSFLHSHSQKQHSEIVEGGEPSSSTLSSMDIVGDSESDSGGGVIRIRTLPPTPLPGENPMERDLELRLRIQSEDAGDDATTSAHAPLADSDSVSSSPARHQRQRSQQSDSQMHTSASPNSSSPNSSAPQPSTSASSPTPSPFSPSPFSPSPSSSSKQRPSLQDFPRPPITKSIDVWALGVTLYCLLTGRTPINALNEFALSRAIHVESVLIPATVGSDALKIPLPSLPSSLANVNLADLSDEELEPYLRRVSLPLGPIWAEKPVVYGPAPPPPPQDNRSTNEEEDEGEVIVKLLGGLLEKDYRKRMTLEQVKSLPWITRDIPNPEAWLRETSPYLHDPVRVSADEVNVAVTALKFEWNPVSFFKRLTGRLKHGVPQGQAGGRFSLGFKHDAMDADLRSKATPGTREGRSSQRRKEGPVVRDYGVQTDKDVRDETERNTKLNRNPSRTRRILGHLTGADHKEGASSRRKRLARQSSTPTTSILQKASNQNGGASVGRAGTVSGVLTLAETGERVNRRRQLPDLSIETRARSMSVTSGDDEGQLFNTESGFDTPRASTEQASASTSNATSPRSAGYTSEEILDEDEEFALNQRQEEEEREEALRQQRQKEKGKGKEVSKDFDGKERTGSIGSKIWHLIGGKSSQSSSKSSIAGDSTPGSGTASNRKKSRHAWGRASASGALSAIPASSSSGSSRVIRMGRRSADEFKTAGSSRGLSAIPQMPYSSNAGRGVGAYHSSTVGLTGSGSGMGTADEDDNDFPVLSNNQRASSWGEVADFYYKERARSRGTLGQEWAYGDDAFAYDNHLARSVVYGADFDTTSDAGLDLGIEYDGEVDRDTEYGLDEYTSMVGAGGVLSNPVSGPSSPGSLSGLSVDALSGQYRDQYQQTVHSIDTGLRYTPTTPHSGPSSLSSPVGEDAPRTPSLMGSPVIHPGGSPQLASGRGVQPPSMLPLPLPLLQPQAEHLLHSTEVPVIANPATQEFVGGFGASGSQAVRRRPSQGQGYQSPKHQLSSPLAQTPMNVDDEEHDRATPQFFGSPSRNNQNYQEADVFEESDESDSESSSKGRIIYGRGSTNLLDEEYGDDDGEGSSGSSNEDSRPIEVKRRRPSESMARSSSQMRRSGSDDERAAG